MQAAVVPCGSPKCKKLSEMSVFFFRRGETRKAVTENTKLTACEIEMMISFQN